MKAPFRQQASNYDCAPTTVLNALTYLFHRKEIPPYVLRRIYNECLDVERYRGTSTSAVQDLGYWLQHYREKGFANFALESKFLYGPQVHFKPSSKIIRTLESNGVALLCVRSSRNYWHYILCIRLEDKWLHCFDPHPPSNQFKNHDAVQFLGISRDHEPNLLIRIDWLEKNISRTNSAAERKYVLGDKEERECLLLNRISTIRS